MDQRSDIALTPQRHTDVAASADDSGEDNGKTDTGATKMGFVWKLLLCAELFGLETVVMFVQLYVVPLLQTLGMPMRLVSLMGLVEGSVSLVILLLIGWLIDRGSNTLRRKTIAMFFGTGLQVIGMTSLVVANVMHLESIGDINNDNNTTTGTSETKLDWLPGTMSWNLSTTALADDFSPATRAALFNVSSGDEATTLSYGNVNDGLLELSTEVPFKAGLGMFSCILISLGFDTMNSVVRSFVLTCSPRAEHTSVLVVGVIMGSAGGLSTAALGIVDFSELLGLSSSFEGGSLVIQTMVQGILACSAVLLTLLVTMLSGRRQRKLTTQYQALPMKYESENSTSLLTHDARTGTSTVDAADKSCQTFADGGINFDASLLLPDQQQQLTEEARTQSEQIHDDAMFEIERSGAVTFDKGCKVGFKTKIACIIMSTYFSFGSILMFAFTGSDFVGKAIYNGDPDAAPGSESLARYEHGMRAAAWGFIVHNGTYVCVSLAHPRVLAKLGCRVEFVATHLLMGMTMLLTSLTQRLEAFYVLAVVAALHRACFFVVPFAVTNDVISARVSSTGGKAKVGLAMSLVTATMPLAFCSMFPWIGPLEELVGSAAVTLWVGTAGCCLASCFMMLLGKV